MKNYLKDNLSKEERAEIISIIWMVVRNHKYRMYQKHKMELTLIDDLDLSYEDLYNFENYIFKDYRNFQKPLTETQKKEIVNQLNILMDELYLFELKRTLTLNEKLVFFFILMEKYKTVQVTSLLSIDRKTVYNRKKSIQDKIRNMKGEL